MHYLPERWLKEYDAPQSDLRTTRQLIEELGSAEHEIAELRAQLAVLSTLAKALGGAE